MELTQRVRTASLRVRELTLMVRGLTSRVRAVQLRVACLLCFFCVSPVVFCVSPVFSAVAFCVSPVFSAVATIRGRVELRQPPADLEPRPNAADLGMPTGHGSTDRRRSVVYLDPAPRAAFDLRDEPRARMDQRNETFVPHVLAIVAGTTVDFPNNDRTYHNVFSLSKARTFDLGRYAAGRSKAVRFDTPGIVRVFCEIHSHMSAYILVFSHRYFAVTDDEGRYRIPNVPAGTYNVLAWNEAMQLESQRTTVPESGDVDLNFVLTRR
jgi:plastocyanin